MHLAANTTYGGYRKHRKNTGQRDPPKRLQGREGVVEKGTLLNSEVILVFSTAALGYPKHDRGEHQPDVLRNVAVAVVLVHLGVVVQDVLEDQDALEKGKGEHALDACIGHEVGDRNDVSKKSGTRKETTHDASSETTSHQGETDKQKQSSPPDRPRIAEPFLPAHPVLVDQVDDEHSEERADSWDPVDERDVHQHRFRLVGGLACAERIAASRKVQLAMANWTTESARYP
jgi:hypothetical protein